MTFFISQPISTKFAHKVLLVSTDLSNVANFLIIFKCFWVTLSYQNKNSQLVADAYHGSHQKTAFFLRLLATSCRFSGALDHAHQHVDGSLVHREVTITRLDMNMTQCSNDAPPVVQSHTAQSKGLKQDAEWIRQVKKFTDSVAVMPMFQYKGL